MLPESVIDQATRFSDQAGAFFRQVPGSGILERYVRSSHQNDPVRSLVELSILLFAIFYLVSPKYSPKKKNDIVLTAQEIDDLVQDWTPDPLDELAMSAPQPGRGTAILHHDAPLEPKTKLNDGRPVINLASHNHYNLSRDPQLVETAVKTIRSYGVGPASAPGFYGTFDVHEQLEQDLAAHFGNEASVIYSQSFITISSVIPCFCKRGDIIVADEAVGYAVRKGIQLSRSTVRWYKHNDMEDLEKVLSRLVRENQSRPLTRRFIITEGMFENTGDIVPLPKIVELKTKYKFRLILEESWSYGILGETGRGVTELLNVDPTVHVDVITGSFSNALAAGGGFCTGSEHVVGHQRYNSAASTFSASLSAFLATTASSIIARLQTPEGQAMIQTLQEKTSILRQQLEKSEWVRVMSAPENPILLVVLQDKHISNRNLSHEDQEIILQDIVDECLSTGSVLVTRLKPMPQAVPTTLRDREKQEWQAQPAIKVCATVGLSKKELEKAAGAIRNAATVVMKRSAGNKAST